MPVPSKLPEVGLDISASKKGGAEFGGRDGTSGTIRKLPEFGGILC